MIRRFTRRLLMNLCVLLGAWLTVRYPRSALVVLLLVASGAREPESLSKLPGVLGPAAESASPQG